MENIFTDREIKYRHLIELEQKLDEIQDVDVLLEKILTETRSIVNADAGSIYIIEGNNLKIKHAQNDTQLRSLPLGEKLPYLFFSFPISKNSIAGYVAETKETLIINDAYNVPESCPYKFNKQTDLTTNYKTKSIYTIPLVMHNGIVLGVLQIINKLDQNGNVISFNQDDDSFIAHFALAAVRALKRAYDTRETHRKMLKLSEFRDPKETYTHVERVSSISLEIYDRWAFEQNIPEEERQVYRDNLKIAAKFHDIGKVGISDVILKKPARFSEEERAIMKSHTCIGAMLFYPPETELDQMSLDVALRHHERWDGSEAGYPGEKYTEANNFVGFQLGDPIINTKPLKGKDIPLAARIVSVADVFDALSHKRCYKDAWSLDDAFSEIQNGSGTQFDPEIVLAFIKVRERVEKILLDYSDIEEI
ncbi:MAG: HD domain-containing protein [Treponema sp.]|nr:HD domain-containing protein [Treponema sp.]